MKRNLFNFALGSLSTFIVVATVIILTSGLGTIPIIFLRLAEQEEGEYDMKIKAKSQLPCSVLNYSKIIENIKNGIGESEYNSQFFASSPRATYTAEIYNNCTHNGVPLPMNITNSFFFNSTYSSPKTLSEIEDLKKNTTSHWVFNGFPDIPHDTNEKKCWDKDEYCPIKLCNGFNVFFAAYDSEKEKKMGFGRNWKLPKLKKGEAYISKQTQTALNIKIGESILLRIPSSDHFIGLFREAGIITDTTKEFNGNVFISLKVKDVYSDNKGKVGLETLETILIDFGTLPQILSDYLKPSYGEEKIKKFAETNMYDYCPEIYFNLPPPRLKKYTLHDYDDKQRLLTEFGSKLFYYIGYNQIETDFPILTYMRKIKFFSLFIGLIINIMITVLAIISIILIYSLLLINVENRTFELGILRMVGMKRFGVINLILLQALFYGVPGLLFGLVFGQLGQIILVYILSEIFQAPLLKNVSLEGFGIATVLGLTIPILSSILPIRSALSKNIHDSVDVEHSKTKAVVVSINRASDKGVSWTLLLLGSGMSIFGFLIYYFFPLTLLSMNITLMLYMFFAILLAMLFGLVILALNVENVLNYIIVTVLFFWENQAIKNLISKNLIAHKMRNRKTTIMFSMSLGFILFIAIAFNQEIASYRYQRQTSYGTRINIDTYTWKPELNDPKTFNKLVNLVNSDKRMTGYTYFSHNLQDVTPLSTCDVSNIGKAYSGQVDLVAVAPNFFDVVNRKFLKFSKRRRFGPSLSHQIYMHEATSSIIMGETFRSLLSMVNDTESKFLIKKTETTSRFPKLGFDIIKPWVFLINAPAGEFSQFLSEDYQTAYCSFPTYVRLSEGHVTSVRDVRIKTFFIELQNGLSEDAVEEIKTNIKKMLLGKRVKIYDVEDRLKSLEIPTMVMNFFFIFSTIVTMFLCFFSLISSMYTNIMEQTKEIGVLRAIGSNRLFLTRLYIYEAFVLIITSSIMGTIIGYLIGYTMESQNALFNQLPLDFYVPWEVMLVVIILGTFFAVFSSGYPILKIIFQPITVILKKLN